MSRSFKQAPFSIDAAASDSAWQSGWGQFPTHICNRKALVSLLCFHPCCQSQEFRYGDATGRTVPGKIFQPEATPTNYQNYVFWGHK